MSAKSRVLIIDDHPVLRRGLAMLINEEADMEVCGQAEDSDGGLEACARLTPDIALVDVSLHESDGVELMRQIVSQDGRILVLAVSMHEETVYAERALRAGARGYITKRAAEDRITEAIRIVLGGGVYLSDDAKKRIMTGVIGSSGTQPLSLVERLSDREFEVLRLLGRGLRPGRVAKTLGVSIKTVETYQANLKDKLELSNSDALTEYAVAWCKANIE